MPIDVKPVSTTMECQVEKSPYMTMNDVAMNLYALSRAFIAKTESMDRFVFGALNGDSKEEKVNDDTATIEFFTEALANLEHAYNVLEVIQRKLGM